MDEGQIYENFAEFGLTRQEAHIYSCLLQNGEMTGYEVAKLTGISRSNVYGGLSGLADKGAAYLIEGASSKYMAVPVKEFCDDKIRSMQKKKEFLIKNMPEVTVLTEGYITIEGAKNIRSRIFTMLEKARQRIYLSAPEFFLESIRGELEAAAGRGIKLVLITDRPFVIKSAILYLSDKKEKQIRLIIDSVYVLTGDIGGTNTDTCLYCGQPNFVNVFKEALRNEIKLIELTKGEKSHEQKDIRYERDD